MHIAIVEPMGGFAMTGVSVKRWILAAAALLAAAAGPAQADNSTPQIIGGTQAPAGRWPFAVAVEFKYSGVYLQDCGGSLIATRWVLTAAHCISNDNGKQVHFPSDTRIMIGSNDLTSGGRRIQAAKVIRHPRYNAFTTDYDVALIKLAQPVTTIKPVAILSSIAAEGTYARTGAPAYVVGWGDTDPSNKDVYPNKLRQVIVPIVARSICNGASAYDGDITQRMVCAGYMKGGKDSCQGDSGGPLIVKDANGVYRLQAGVVSFGNGCAARNFPGVYSRLAVLSPWIKQVLANQ